MSYFKADHIKELLSGLDSSSKKAEEIFEAFTSFSYRCSKSREFAYHGLLRRIQSLQRCIQNVFSILPPDTSAIPSSDLRHDVEVNIHAFVIHVFGCLDNLAWIWVLERSVTKEDGAPLPAQWVGLRKKNEAVRRSFTIEFQNYLASLDDWMEYLESYRHSLAHRVPLYIPPFVVQYRNIDYYRNLELQIEEASRNLDHKRSNELQELQNSLKSFRPVMQHSFEEEAKPVVFHAQMLADFNTVHELSLNFSKELGCLLQ